MARWRSLQGAGRNLPHGIIALISIAPTVAIEYVPPSIAWGADVAKRPNVVLILADDLGYGDLGCYNDQSKIPTPRIDRLAREGMRFTDAHTPCSVCSPTRYGLLTGRYAWRTRLKSGVLNGYSRALVEPGRLTLASLLKEQGYRTACVGKWHLGLGTDEPADYGKPLTPGPNSVGFDESFVLPASLDMPPYVFVENERVTIAPSDKIAGGEMRRRGGNGFWREGAIAPGFKHADTLPTLAGRATGFVGRQTPERPFFLYFALTAPHTPWMPTNEYRGRSGAGYYGDFVAQVDATVGKVLDALEQRHLADNTLVIVTSDNGAHWLSSDIEQWRHRANGSWRGQKADLWEGGHRVPFIVRWPGKVAPNGRSDELICLTDCMATLAAIVGTKLPAAAGEDSFDVLPVLLGQKSAHPVREAIVHHSSDGTFAIRQGVWKLATKLGSHGFSDPKDIEPQPHGPTGQLYDLSIDPAESHNRWLEQPEIVERLTKLLAGYQKQDRTRRLGD
ncbi:MAG TPA: arylsulfatase [Pirellulales bacterium]|jgi:arylsulfatase A-like enzyme|nr:arylsulfatase [Pirellulales bacterium]